MRNEEIIIDLADPVFTKIIRSRQNDRNGLKITVYVREKGQPVDLTGCAVKYEAINQIGKFVRDDAQIVDAKNGVFSYTFTSQAVSTSDDWTAYFVMEKSTERMSTPDIRITLRRDVKEGNIKIENYISDFEKAIEQVAGYRKEIDDTNKKIADTNNKFTELTTLINAKGVQVPKTTTDNGGATISVSDATKNILDEIVAKGQGMNTIYCHGSVQGNTPNSKSWRGISFINSPTFGFVIAKDYQNKLFTNYIDNGKWLGWVEHVIKEDFVGWDFTVQGFKRSSDTEWITLKATGVEIVPDRPLKYKRSGEQITVIGSVRNPANTTVFATLPAGFRPVQNIAFPALVYGGVPTVCEVTVKSDGGIFVNGVQSGNTVHLAMSFLI
ncbi:BppU family phage baseplate upper protein [Bacillus paramycoides]|uniref:BppU family phage baseplate upper protein n=1 Tax=Bacillus paramycoides TaxID=2026194 RepID=UPI0011A7C2E2|nr:BppU family phage baseplate upper protein [Bacillus paramycoides]